MCPMIATCAPVARAGAVRVKQRERPTIPGGAQGWRERGDLAGGGLEHGGELGLDHEQSLVGGRRGPARPGRAASRSTPPRSRGRSTAGRERGVGFAHQPGDVIKRRSLAGLAAVTDQDQRTRWGDAGSLRLGSERRDRSARRSRPTAGRGSRPGQPRCAARSSQRSRRAARGRRSSRRRGPARRRRERDRLRAGRRRRCGCWSNREMSSPVIRL